MGAGKQFKGKQHAVQKGYPCIHLGDAGGNYTDKILYPRDTRIELALRTGPRSGIRRRERAQ